MKVLLLGAGGMGALAARTVAQFDVVQQLIIGDIDPAAAAHVAKQCGAKAQPMQLDVMDQGALGKALQAVDLCLNLVGPFFRFGPPVLEAAIRHGTDYIDICDDPEPTLVMLALDELAKAHGVKALVGLGASPGITNLLAVMAHDALDECQHLTTAWSLEEGNGELEEDSFQSAGKPSAAIVHWLEQCSGQVQVFKDGKQQAVNPLQPRNLEVPGFGHRRVWTVGHPEAVTLPLTFTKVNRSENVMILPPGAIALLQELRSKIDQQQLTLEAAAVQLEKSFSNESPSLFSGLVNYVLEHWPRARMPALLAQASGRKQGLETTISAYPLRLPGEGMAGVTGVPLAIGAKLFAENRGLKQDVGVHTPESLLEPTVFFQALDVFCTHSATPGRPNISGSELIQIVQQGRANN